MNSNTYTEQEIDQIAHWVITTVKSKLICFNGEMGAGKTTLIKSVLQQINASDFGQSPSFGIVNSYEDQHGKPLCYHFDFYRIEDESEAYDLGIDDYLNSDQWLFIEWSERIQGILPKNYSEVRLEIVDKDSRNIKLIEH